MNLLDTIHVTFLLLKSLTPWNGDADTVERDALLGITATAMVIAGESDPSRIVLLAVQGHAESKFARRIGAGNCGPYECDAAWIRAHGKRVKIHKARHFWQGHRRARDGHLWDAAVGTGLAPTLAAATLADSYLKQCGGNIEAKFNSQSGVGCQAPIRPEAKKRAERYRQLMGRWAKLKREVAQ